MPVEKLSPPRAIQTGPRPHPVLDRIGKTPLLDLTALLERQGAILLGKAELANPGGSVKDRPALAMVLDAERRGLLGGGRRILDSTSGNTGIAYAMIGAARGHGVTLCVPGSASQERLRLLRALRAEVILTDPLEGSDGAIREARRLAREESGRYSYLDQYSNPENWRAHLRSTGPEIWMQTQGRVTHFITGLGTSGTFTGVGRFLRRRNRRIRLISVEPDGPLHGIEGLKHMATATVPAFYDRSLADEAWSVTSEEAQAMTKRVVHDLGVLVGVSSGANVAAAVRLASRLEEGTVVTILCDGAERYLSERFWEEG